MAGQIDGSIVVDAGINTESFNRGSDALKREMAQLQKRFDSVSKRLESSVARYVNALTTGDNKSVRHFSDELGKAQDAANRFRDVVSRLGDEYRSMSADIDKAQEALSRLQDRQAKMKATGVKENSKAYQSLMYDIQQAQHTLEEYKADFNAALGIKDNADVTILNPEELQEFGNVVERIKERLSALQKDEGVESLVNDIEKAASAVERYQARVDKMSALGASENQWRSVQYDISEAAESAEELMAELERLSQYGGVDETQYDELSERLSALIGDYDNLQATVEGATQDEAEAERGASFLGGAFGILSEKVRSAAQELASMAGAAVLAGLRTIGEAASEAARNLTSMTSRAVTGGIRRLGAWLSNAAKSMTLFGRSAKRNNGILKKSFTTILKYGLGVRSFYFLFRKVRQAIAEGYQNLARYSDTLNQSVSGVISSFKRFENQFAASFEPLVNIVAPAITRMIDGLTEATYRAGQFIAALSGQKTVIRAKEVQENYAASLDKTKKAAKDAERQLAEFDRLTILKKPDEDENLNPEDMFETVPVDDKAKDFADAFKEAWVNVDLSDIGGTIGGKLKIALDNIPWPDIQQGAEDMGKRLATFLNGLINVPDLGKSIGKSLAEAVNTAFAFLDGFVWEFEWGDLGNALMDAIEAACDNLEWERINHALQGLAIGLADLLNTIFSRKEVWEKIGRTVGEAINAAVLFGLTFLERFNFKQAASAIVAGLNAAVATIRFDNIGQLLGDLLGGALQFLYTAVTEFDWVKLGNQIAVGVNAFTSTVRRKIYDINWADMGTAIADGINTAIIGIEWGGVGETVGMLFGGALTAVASFIRGLNYGEIVQAIQDFFSGAIQQVDFYDLITVWGVATLIVAVKKIIATHPVLAILVGAALALGPELGNAIHKMVEDIPWEELAQQISDFLVSTLSRLNEAVSSVNWGEIGAKVYTFLSNIDWASIIGEIVELIMNVLAGGLAMIAGFLREMGPLKILEAIGIAVATIAGGIALLGIANIILSAILPIIAGIFAAIVGVLASPAVILVAIGGLLLAIIAHILGGKKDMEESGENLMGGFFQGILKIFANIGAWIKEHIFQPFIDAWHNLWQEHSPSKVMENEGGLIISGLFNGITAAWRFITDFFGGALDGLKATLGGAWDAISGAAKTAWNGISATLSGIAGGIATTIGDTWENVKTDAVSEWNGLKSSVVSSALSVKSQVASAFQSLQGTLSGVWGGIRSAASGALSSVSSTVSSMVTSISSRVSSIRTTVSNITSSASDALSRVADKMDNLTRKASNGVSLGGFASGGVVRDGGRMSWWGGVRKYASGTLKAAGSLFVAGEAGPEIVGHVNGRTEVLNESQIAGAIYSAVLAAMGEAVKTFGSWLSTQMASNTNALITAIGQIQAPEPIAVSQTDAALMERLAALSSAPYQVPAYATGTVMPYEVVAEIRRQTSEITSAIHDEGEEIIRAIVSAIANHGLSITDAIGKMPVGQGQSYGRDDMARYTIDEINRRTRMNGRSPLLS